MFQPYMVFYRNYKAFMIFQPWRTHKSTATLPVYIPQSIMGSVKLSVYPHTMLFSPIQQELNCLFFHIPRIKNARKEKHAEAVKSSFVKSSKPHWRSEMNGYLTLRNSLCGFTSSLQFSIKHSTTLNLSLKTHRGKCIFNTWLQINNGPSDLNKKYNPP